MSRTAVISGASSGIGAACARHLARQGWTTVLLARRGARLQDVADEVGGRALVVDVTTLQEGDLADVGPVDLLVNAAGGALGADPVATAAPDDWTSMYEVNVLGTLRLTQLLLPRLIESQGLILTITSTAALAGYEGGAGYCAAKSGARALMQSLRLELLGEPVRVTEVLPGMVRTPEFAVNRFRGDEDKAAAVYAGVDRPLVADDVARVVTSIAELPSHVNVDEVVVRPVAQRSQHALHRGPLDWHDSLSVQHTTERRS